MKHQQQESEMKLLKEVYKTYEGARKRAAFENAMAKGEFARGDKAKLYSYRVVDEGTTWRVARTVKGVHNV
jgi:hypothetical protein